MKSLRGYAPALALFAFLLTILVIGLIVNPFEYDTDEGLNLIKAMLVGRGYALYTQIWSDQPPVLTHLLAWLFKLTGPSVVAGRVLVLGFSCLLLTSLYHAVLVIERDRVRAWTVVVLAAACAWYASLSFSVMIGLPALALGLLAVWLAAESRSRTSLWLAALSGVAMALSLQTKLFTFMMLPMLMTLLLAPIPTLREIPMKQRVFGLIAAATACIVVFIAIQTITREPLRQVVSTHLTVSSQAEEVQPTKVYTVVRRDWPLSFLAVFSIGLIRRNNLWRQLLPLIWLGVAIISLQMHSPIWRHHSLLLTLPAAWAGATSLLWLCDAGRNCWVRCAGIALACYVVGFGVRNITRLVLPDLQDETDRKQLLTLVQQHQSETKWLYTDVPMVAFRAGIPIPPAVAVVSVKRVNAGQLSDAEILDALRQYRPEQIAIGRVLYNPEVQKYIADEYRITWQERKVAHYMRADLPDAPPRPEAQSPTTSQTHLPTSGASRPF